MGYATNTLKTVILIALLTALMLWLGNLFGGTAGLVIALVFVLLLNGTMYWFSDRIVLWMYGAKELPKGHDASILVREVAQKAGVPTPKTYIIDSQTPNAFATGRSPKRSAVAVTAGILRLLDKEELEGVIAHEMSHIKNRDTLIQTVAGVLAGVIGYLANMMQWAAIFGFGDRDREGGGGLIGLLALAIITPIVATIVQLAISRTREYLADESAARILHNSKGLSRALKKLEAGNKAHPFHGEGSAATSSLFIVNPFRGSFWLEILSTHPPMGKRIAKLEALKF